MSRKARPPAEQEADRPARRKRPLWRSWRVWIGAVATAAGAALLTTPQYLDAIVKILKATGDLRPLVCAQAGVWCPPRTWDIEVRPMPALPHGLANSLTAPVMVTTVKTVARRRLEVELELEYLSDFLRRPGSPTIRLGTHPVERDHPYRLPFSDTLPFLRSRFDRPTVIRVTWQARNRENENDRRAQTVEIRLLPTNTVDWDLRTAAGDPVPRDFLVASLVAWTLSPPEAVAARARGWLARLGAGDAGTRVTRWFELAWSDLLHGPGALFPSPYRGPFPSSGQEIVKTPGEVLDGRTANPLEAALLLAALKHAAEFPEPLVLAVQTPPGQPASFLLAWQPRQAPWRAVDLGQGTQPFAANEPAASARAAGLLAEPGLARRLAETGVLLDPARSLCVVDFRRAREAFYIRPLP